MSLSIVVANEGQGGPPLSNFLAYLAIMRFEKQCSKIFGLAALLSLSE